MPIRLLREGILTSERVNLLSPAGEVFYRRLMSIVDDYGRYFAKPELLRAACFPLKLDKVGNSEISKWIAEGHTAGLIATYTVDGKAYLEVLDFRQQIRAKESKFPQIPETAKQLLSTCTADAKQMLATAHLDVVGDVVESGAARNGARGTRLTLSALPEDWGEFCKKERQDLDPTSVFASFRDYWIAQPGQKGVKADWTATWRNWVRRDNGTGRTKKPPDPNRLHI